MPPFFSQLAEDREKEAVSIEDHGLFSVYQGCGEYLVAASCTGAPPFCSFRFPVCCCVLLSTCTEGSLNSIFVNFHVLTSMVCAPSGVRSATCADIESTGPCLALRRGRRSPVHARSCTAQVKRVFFSIVTHAVFSRVYLHRNRRTCSLVKLRLSAFMFMSLGYARFLF